MHPIARDSRPAWYELSIIDTELVVHVHKESEPLLRELLCCHENAVFSDGWIETPPFIPPTKSEWGFGPAIKTVRGIRTDWIQFFCPIPQIRAKHGDKPDWQPAYALCATLVELFNALYCCDILTDIEHSQLLTIDGLTVKEGRHGGSIYATISRDLVQWARECEPTELREKLESVSATMEMIYNHMWSGTAIDDVSGDFLTKFRLLHWFNLCCPGNATELQPERLSEEADEKGSLLGYSVCSHNSDGPLTQLTLLAGLAKLHELARSADH